MHVSIIGDATTASVLLARVSSWFDKQVAQSGGSYERSLEAGSIFAPNQQAGIRIWVWLRSPGAARLFFAVVERPGAEARYLVSDQPLERGLDELGMEELGQVVYASAMALWTGSLQSTRRELEAGLPAAPAPPPAPEPAPPARKPTVRARLRLGVEYTLRLRGDEGGAHLPGALAGIALASDSTELTFLVHAGVFVPRTEHAQGIDLRLTGTSLSLGAGGALRVSDALWLTSEFGAGLDFAHYAPSSTDSHVQAGEAQLDLRPALFGALGARVEAGAVQFGLRACVTLQLVHTHYDLDGPDGRRAVLTPWPVQPGLAAQIAW